MKDSAGNISSLREELSLKDSSWRNLQHEWAPSYKKPHMPIKTKTARKTYMDHVMAESLNSDPTGTKCMFEAAISEMIPSKPENGTIENRSFGELAMLEGDNFALDWAGINPHDVAARSVPDFSRFLLSLAGEPILSSTLDPLRDIERFDTTVAPPVSRSDRLI